jgi:hypothetical protein
MLDDSRLASYDGRNRVNPPLREASDAEALRRALADGVIDCVATDHAPHTLDEKQRPYLQAPSGLPLVQHALPSLLELVADGLLPLTTLVEKTSHAVAQRGIYDAVPEADSRVAAVVAIPCADGDVKKRVGAAGADEAGEGHGRSLLSAIQRRCTQLLRGRRRGGALRRAAMSCWATRSAGVPGARSPPWSALPAVPMPATA